MLPTLVDLSLTVYQNLLYLIMANTMTLSLGLHIARQGRPKIHCVRSLHHDQKANGTGGGLEHDGVVGGGHGQHEGIGQGHSS